MVAAGQRRRLALTLADQRARARCGGARQHRQPQRPSHHERGVDNAGCQPRLGRLDVVHRRQQHRVEADARTHAQHQHGRQHIGQVVAVDGHAREQQKADRPEQHARDQRRPDAEAHHQLRGDADREPAHQQVGGQEREPHLQRRVAEHQLQVQRRQEEPGEHRGRRQHADHVGRGQVPEPEQPQRHQRRRHARLDHQEQDQQPHGDTQQAERLAGHPTHPVAVHDRVDRDHQRRGHGHRAGDVQTAPSAPPTGRPAPGSGRRRTRRCRPAG